MATPSDRYAWILFVTLLGMCLVVAVLFVVEEPHEEREVGGVVERVYRGHGIPHPGQLHMKQGGDGLARHEGLLLTGWGLAALQLLFITVCLCLAMSRAGARSPATKPLAAVGLVGLAVVTCLFLSYRDYMTGVDRSFFLGLPVPTAWLVFGIWGFPLLFTGVYIALFERWYVTPAVMERFSEVRDRRLDEEADR